VASAVNRRKTAEILPSPLPPKSGLAPVYEI
jgi:hypothetical protein